MDQQLPRHEKIRFRRDEIADLSALPSACAYPPLGQAAIGRGRRLVVRFAAAVVSLFLLAVAALYAIGWSGIGADRLRSEAEAALGDLAGIDARVSLGQTGITLDGSSFIALQVHDVGIRRADGQQMVEAGLVRFGIRFLPLLVGQVSLSSVKISDARVFSAALPSGEAVDWSAPLRTPDGLFDPDKVTSAVFSSLRQGLDAVGIDTVRRIDLDNVDIVLPEAGQARLVKVQKASVRHTGTGMALSSRSTVDGRLLTLEASAGRDAASQRVSDLAISAQLSSAGTAETSSGDGEGLGTVTLQMTGSEGAGQTPSSLKASLGIEGYTLDLGPRGLLSLDVDAQALLVAGANKVDLDRFVVSTGRSTFDFKGSIGPKPPSAGEAPTYRFDMVSDGSTLAPSESPEPAMKFIARVAGTFDPAANRFVADTIGVRSGVEGGVTGTAALELEDGKAPGVSVALDVQNMPVSHVKQLWPWFSARNARLWVLENLFGGRVAEGSLHYSVAPGRAGNGVPLTADEVSGRFRIEGSRFDTAGRIPPIRDAVGVVDFRGNDVDIALKSGTVYMPSGRVVAASDGTLKVKNANVPPVIGALDIDVVGEAPAIAELASYDPINAMRHVGLKPEEMSGQVSGHVTADIPLQSGVDTDKLGWKVSLNYKGLSLSKPFDGQIVSDADGSIVVEPRQATISARARLNGIPAELDLVEPLEDDGPPRSRKVVLVLDDKTRETFMPGLSVLLSGTVKVALDGRSDGSQDVRADLGGARLDIPWAGWSKGPGVPATVSFSLNRSGGTATLSDFRLDGKSFALAGSVVLDRGSLSSARFDKVVLNRGDSVAVSIRRSGGGYGVTVSGASLDARPLIKQVLSDADAATGSSGSDRIAVKADIKSLTGFNDERVSNFKLDYNASGSRVNGFNVSATAGSGGAITVSNTAGDGQRTLNMRSADAGAILRFLDIYDHMQGGAIALALSGSADGPMRGQVDARDFLIVNEPKLASIVSTTPQGDNRSLNQAVNADIDTAKVRFERGYSEIEKGGGYLRLANGVLRGPLIGTTFQGTLYDKNNNMDMTGTFMPAYGINRIFGEIPIFGALLGNGRDRALIGVTYRLRGDANKPQLNINPLSVIAPGIFRSIFEFR